MIPVPAGVRVWIATGVTDMPEFALRGHIWAGEAGMEY